MSANIRIIRTDPAPFMRLTLKKYGLSKKTMWCEEWYSGVGSHVYCKGINMFGQSKRSHLSVRMRMCQQNMSRKEISQEDMLHLRKVLEGTDAQAMWQELHRLGLSPTHTVIFNLHAKQKLSTCLTCSSAFECTHLLLIPFFYNHWLLQPVSTCLNGGSSCMLQSNSPWLIVGSVR